MSAVPFMLGRVLSPTVYDALHSLLKSPIKWNEVKSPFVGIAVKGRFEHHHPVESLHRKAAHPISEGYVGSAEIPRGSGQLVTQQFREVLNTMKQKESSHVVSAYGNGRYFVEVYITESGEGGARTRLCKLHRRNK